MPYSRTGVGIGIDWTCTIIKPAGFFKYLSIWMPGAVLSDLIVADLKQQTTKRQSKSKAANSVASVTSDTRLAHAGASFAWALGSPFLRVQKPHR